MLTLSHGDIQNPVNISVRQEVRESIIHVLLEPESTDSCCQSFAESSPARREYIPVGCGRDILSLTRRKRRSSALARIRRLRLIIGKAEHALARWRHGDGRILTKIGLQ